MERRTRTEVTPIVRQSIEEEALNAPRSPAWILDRKVQRRLKKKNVEDPLPRERAIQTIAREARRESNYLENIWSPAHGGDETPPEALSDLLAVWKVCIAKDVRFTVRKARVVSRLRGAVPNSSDGAGAWSRSEELLEWSELYAGREYAAMKTGQPLNTLDLDAELAFQPWLSLLHRWQYEQAVGSGAVPPSGRKDGWDTADFFYDEAINLLKAADEGSDILETVWYPEARAVVIFWLRTISSKIQRWNAAYWDDLSGEDKVSWGEMGRHLTNEVVAKARQLERHIPAPSEPDTNGYLVWEPSETLKEVGLL